MASLTPTDWLQAAAQRITQQGVEAVRIEAMAKDLGVSKGSFYWHFADRDALLKALLEGWRQRGTDQVITMTQEFAGSPAERLNRLMTVAHNHPQDGGFEVAVRTWAGNDEVARAAVLEVDSARINYVAQLLREAGLSEELALIRSRMLYRALLGDYLQRKYRTPAATPAEIAQLSQAALAG